MHDSETELLLIDKVFFQPDCQVTHLLRVYARKTQLSTG